MRIRLGKSDRALAERLIHLGAAGVGGCTNIRDDGDAIWVERAPGSTLAEWMGERPGPQGASLAVSIVASLAEAAAICEAAALFPGPIAPETVIIAGDRAQLRADSLIAALTGDNPDRREASSRWASPEQASGAPVDNASNRYVLGLLLYRLLTGAHPFVGRGLRLGLEDQAQRGAPPFPDAIAAELPAGLQALCLRMLDPDPAQRPRSAAEIARQLRDLPLSPSQPSLSPSRSMSPLQHSPSQRLPSLSLEPSPSSSPSPLPAKPRSSSPRPPRPPRPLPRALTLLPIPVALAIAALALASVDHRRHSAIRAGDATPLSEARAVADCAGCHPRQTAEWKRSVMAHSAQSPLFQALEILIEEQVGRDAECPGGAGILRAADPATACNVRRTGTPLTGSGGELWCVNCHAPGENLRASLPAWDGRSARSSTRLPLRDALSPEAMEGISCTFCHQVTGPVHPGDAARGLYEGNPSWRSPVSGQRFLMRPEDSAGRFGIANSGYALDPGAFLVSRWKDAVPGGAHAPTPAAQRSHLRSSEFCGGCHDVRLFGTDVLGSLRGEHFKRLRNAYSEWVSWGEGEIRQGRTPASCQDCHMSAYGSACEPSSDPSITDAACPSGMRRARVTPGTYPVSRLATGERSAVTTHYFTGVDVPLTEGFDFTFIDDETLDAHGVPLGARQRRDLLLSSTFRFELPGARRFGDRLELPLVVENIGAGHRVPAGFSQEREIWVHLKVTDGNGRVVYEVGRVDRPDEDLRDKIFSRVNTSPDLVDAFGRPQGLFGADVIDGPDLPQWSPAPATGATFMRGKGLINLQNGFLRCVTCIGRIDADGRCQAGPGQGTTRADRFADGGYDIDTGACFSNLRGENALFETYFPVGALDATRGEVKGPDAIIDTRSLPPGTPTTYVYELPVTGSAGPFRVEARLMFRAFPPFLLRAFAEYEEAQEQRGLRPGGALITRAVLARLDVVEIARVEADVP